MTECLAPFFGHCGLDLVSRISVSGAYLLYYLTYESQMLRVDASNDGGVPHYHFGANLTSDLVYRIFVSENICYFFKV